MASEFLNPLSNNDSFFRNTINDAIGNRQKAMDPIHDMNKGAFTFLTSFANAQKDRDLKAKLTADQLASEEKRARESNIMDAAKILGQVGWDIYKGRRGEKRDDEQRDEDREWELEDAAEAHRRQKELENMRREGAGIPSSSADSMFDLPGGQGSVWPETGSTGGPSGWGEGANLDSMDFLAPQSNTPMPGLGGSPQVRSDLGPTPSWGG